MKKILLFIAITASLTVNAQIRKVSLQASGLTCSMCSNAINRSLKTLDFVQQVDADFKSYTFEISFKPGYAIDFDMLRQKVENAGFTVCAFIVDINFSNLQLKNTEPVIIQNNSFLFVNPADQVLDGSQKIKIVDKGFVTPKEYKKNGLLVASPPIYHVTL